RTRVMPDSDNQVDPRATRDVASLVFVGFNSRVAALARATGELVWKWKCPKGTGPAAVLLDGDRLIVSVQGYTYCLDPLTGDQWWYNSLKAMGIGVPCLASAQGNTTSQLSAILAHFQEQQNASAGGD